jgi:chromosome partitioning protein
MNMLWDHILGENSMPTIAITSFKGGTAKTSTLLHLGAALSRLHKKKILLIDFDAQANLTAGLGFDPDEHDSLAAVLQDNKTIQEVILHTNSKGLDLIPADTWLERVEVTGALAGDRYSHEKLKKILKDLNYDYILIDTPPSLCWLTESALIAAEHTLIAATPEFYSVKGLERLSQFIESISERHPLHVLGVSLSFWNARGRNNTAFMELIEKTFPERLLQSKIRRDISVSEAAIFGKPVFDSAPTCRAAEDYIALTKEILLRLKVEEKKNPSLRKKELSHCKAG